MLHKVILSLDFPTGIGENAAPYYFAYLSSISIFLIVVYKLLNLDLSPYKLLTRFVLVDLSLLLLNSAMDVSGI